MMAEKVRVLVVHVMQVKNMRTNRTPLKMLLLCTPVIIYSVGLTSMAVSELLTTGGIFLLFETFTDVLQSWILVKFFNVPIMSVEIRPNFKMNCYYAGSIVAMAQCTQMGFRTFDVADSSEDLVPFINATNLTDSG